MIVIRCEDAGMSNDDLINRNQSHILLMVLMANYKKFTVFYGFVCVTTHAVKLRLYERIFYCPARKTDSARWPVQMTVV